jgi:hypothetical protein
LNQQVDTDLPGAIQTYEDGKAAVQAQIVSLAELVDLHEAWWYWYHDDVASKYEDELKWYNGHFIVEPVTDTDFDEARAFTPDCRLFPTGYVKLKPKYINQLKGITDEGPGDQLKNVEDCLHPICYELALALRDGLSGAGSSLTGNVVTPATTSITVATTGWGSGSMAAIYSVSGKRAVFRVDSTSGIGPYILSGAVVAFCAADDQIGIGAVISDSPAVQQSAMDGALTDLISALNSQKSALQGNKDDISYSGVDTDIANAITQIDNAVAVYGAYASFALLVSAMETRAAFWPTRSSQIDQAINTATDGIYDRRYRWLNNLVNRSGGSYAQLDGAEASIDFFDANIAYLEDQKADLEEWS